MTASEKISSWIIEQEKLGKDRDTIARGHFVHTDSDGHICVYSLSKSGKTKYDLKGYIGAVNLNEWEPNEQG